MKNQHQSEAPNCPLTYQIKVQGKLDEEWADWFCCMTFLIDSDSGDSPTTTLTCTVADQSELRGILNRIWDLNLALISVNQIEKWVLQRYDPPQTIIKILLALAQDSPAIALCVGIGTDLRPYRITPHHNRP